MVIQVPLYLLTVQECNKAHLIVSTVQKNNVEVCLDIF